MKERPLKFRDSFLGDLANAIALRPAYRPPADIPTASKTVTLQPTAESATAEATAQRKAEEKAQTAVQHEAQEETTTAQTTAPLYRYLKEEQERSFAPTPVQQEQSLDLAVMILDGEEYVSVNGINISRSTLDRLLERDTSERATVQELRQNNVQSENTGVVVKQYGYPWKEEQSPNYLIRPGSDLTGFWNIKRSSDHVEVNIIEGKHSADPDDKQTGQPLPPSSSGGKYTVVDSKQVPASTHEAVKASPEATRSSQVKSSGFTRKRTIPNLPSGTGRVQRILKPKLKASQLKGMGFSQQEATVLEGLFRGRRINSIAARLSTKPATVLHIVKQLMAKFEAATMNSLLKKVWSLHRDSKQMTLIQAAAVRALLSDDEPPRSETQVLGGLVVVNSGTVIERPKGINIPAGHPDHPANDEGAKKRGNQEGKRTPAHSKATPSPRKNTDS